MNVSLEMLITAADICSVLSRYPAVPVTLMDVPPDFPATEHIHVSRV